MNVQISFCHQTTFTKCTTQKVLENLIFTSTFLTNLPHVFERKSVKLTSKQIASDCQTYKANDIKLFNLSQVFFFFSLDNESCSYLVNHKFSFCFHYAIKWATKVCLSLIIKKEYTILQTSLECCLPFRLQKQTSEKIHEKVNSAFGQVAATTISYTEFGYQNRFWCSWLISAIGVVSDKTLIQWIAGWRLNNQELISCGSIYRLEWLELKENVIAG